MSLFTQRHIGPNSSEKREMLTTIGEDSIDDLVNKTIPEQIRMSSELNIPEALSEQEYLNHIQEKSALNKVNKSALRWIIAWQSLTSVIPLHA